MARRPEHAPVKIGRLNEACAVFAALKEIVFVVAVEGCEGVGQAQDILSNSGIVVMNQPRINSNSHKWLVCQKETAATSFLARNAGKQKGWSNII